MKKVIYLNSPIEFMDLKQKQNHFEQEYSALFDAIYRFTRYRVSEIHEAEDLVSEIFITAYQKLHSFNPALGSLKNWLFQITQRKIIDYWRSKKLTVDLEKIADLFEEESNKNQIDNDLFLEKAFASLNPEAKALLAFRYVDNLKYKEIAEITGKKPETVKKIFSRLHAKLRLELQSFE